MYIERSGSGPDLILVHGWAMHGGIFAPLTQLLAKRFCVHAVDLPGHGRNREFIARPCDITTTFTNWVEAILDATPAALWVGWSLGGLLALQAAIARPAQVLGLVEIASSPYFVKASGWDFGIDGAQFERFAADLAQNFRGAIERFLALETLGAAHAQAELRALKAHIFERGDPDINALHAGLQMLGAIDLRSDVASLQMPNLWIAGRRDRLVPAAAMAWSAQQNAAGQFVALPAAHAPFMSDADAVAAAIFAFATRAGLT